MNNNSIHGIPYPEGCFIRFLKNTLTKREGTFNKDDSNKSVLHKKEVTIQNEASDYQKSLFREILEIPEIWIYLHGSRADNTSTSFSDYDDLIIVDTAKLTRSRRCTLARKLIRVDRRFTRLDPLQHHGHWMISRQCLENYNASYIPLSVLNTAVRIQGPKTIRYKVDIQRTKYGMHQNIQSMCKNIQSLYYLYINNRINIFKLKGLVGSFVLMPAFIFQYLGDDVDKKTGILRARELFGTNAHMCLKWSTEHRYSWDRIMELTVDQLYLSVLMKAVRNPHVYRKIVNKVAPSIDIRKISLPKLDPLHVNSFIEESLSYIK
jgi:hypothetical protein